MHKQAIVDEYFIPANQISCYALEIASLCALVGVDVSVLVFSCCRV